PIARVPLVVLDDGRVQSESNALLLHWGEGTPLVPRDPFARTEVLRWMFFEQNLHEPHVATRRYWVSIARKDPDPPQVLAYWLRRGNEALRTMERHLADHAWFGPEGASAADVALYAYTHVADEGGFDLQPLPAVRAWLARFAARPDHFPLGGRRSV
ncbi:MAG TPA: glutathione S-transferase family protein, partial [Planctomycetota bacterium]|nr:glutathione S-transferase family protein [Planctomycetota bacterium]